MKNFRINPNKKLVDVIIEGLQKKDGHCPCRINVDDTTLCPCDEFIKDGICKCKLFIPIEKSVEDK
jgi:ferredoxin-thioredoxin reductase catalytic subunit